MRWNQRVIHMLLKDRYLQKKTTNERMKQFIAIMSIYKIQNLQLLHMGFIVNQWSVCSDWKLAEPQSNDTSIRWYIMPSICKSDTNDKLYTRHAWSRICYISKCANSVWFSIGATRDDHSQFTHHPHNSPNIKLYDNNWICNGYLTANCFQLL